MMRITQMMLTQRNLQHISQNYNRLGELQDQLNTGKKITRPSQDPVVAMKGIRYRSEVVEIEQFQRNLSEGFNWLENADEALSKSGQVIHRVRELMTEAANDSYDDDERKNIAKEIEQLKDHIYTLANTKVGDKYIFNGTATADRPVNLHKVDLDFTKFQNDLVAGTIDPNEYTVSFKGKTYQYQETNVDTAIFVSGGEKIKIDTANNEIFHEYESQLPYKNGQSVTVNEEITSNDIVISHESAVSTNKKDVKIEVMNGIEVPINVQPQGAFSLDLFGGLASIKKMLLNPETKGEEISEALGSMDQLLDNITLTRAEIGSRVNRLEMVENRLMSQEVMANKIVSDNEDIDMEKVITELKTQESVHRASLAAGARIIQPTLMDFLR